MAVDNFFGVKKGLNIKPQTLPVSGNLGDMAFDSLTNTFKQWNGLNWADITGGAGGINYIDNAGAENALTGWATYADAGGAIPVDGTGGAPNVTFTRTTTLPMRDNASFLFTKDAANRQGQGASYDFLIDPADQGKVVSFYMDYQIASGTYADGDLIGYIYDITNAVLIQPVPITILNHALPSEKFKFEFQAASNSVSYRLIFHVATTSALAYTVKMDNMSMGPNARFLGRVVVPWTSYSYTIKDVVGTVVESPSPITKDAQYMIDESGTMYIKGSYYHTAVTGILGNTGGHYRWSMPPGYTGRTDLSQGGGNSTCPAGFFMVDTGGTTPLLMPGFCPGNYFTTGSNVVGDGQTNTNGGIGGTGGAGLVTFNTANVGVTWNLQIPLANYSSVSTIVDDGYQNRTTLLRVRRNNVAISTTSGVAQTVIWNIAPDEDTVGALNTSTGVYTFKSAMTMRASASMVWGSDAGTGFRGLRLNHIPISTGTPVTRKQFRQELGITGFTQNNYVEDTFSVQAGDQIYIELLQNSGANRSTSTDGNVSIEQVFTIEKVSGPGQVTASNKNVSTVDISSGQVIPDGVSTVVIFNNNYSDYPNVYNSGTGEVTIAEAGDYHFSSQISFNTAAAGIYSGDVLVNNLTPVPATAGVTYMGQSGGPYQVQTGIGILKNLKVGDKVKLRSYQGSGAPQAILGGWMNLAKVK